MGASRKNLLYNKAATSAILYGELNECIAISTFEEFSKTNVVRCGLFVDKYYNFLAAWPDGLVGEVAILEVKCQKSAENMTIIIEATNTNKTFIRKWTKIQGKFIIIRLVG